jgi:predicted DNA-binding protein (MmcQ/YjbR family)
MNIEELREYCIAKPYVVETFPFDEETLVFKVMGKAFILTGISAQPLRFNVKCNPEHAIELREKYNYVLPGYHMNKQHWNTIVCESAANKKLLKQWIDDSYQLIIESLPKKVREELRSTQQSNNKKLKP